MFWREIETGGFEVFWVIVKKISEEDLSKFYDFLRVIL